ncbi:PTS sugar transporter subunit IIB [Vagococcus xieshaowenii]|uniref:PTS fructose transporter subunit IIB n=1 Tax=Vagococcus xieshaowenii TaxID=2562451 RepID=A0A4Z0DBV3_9ENTE|nr:PTS sugar transporter subunit IIB [Vagococcus xieshaowenii]QCA28276.1 PTS fructose transporter subunit IIB [Vagococcus xieshaowenii]TFZ42336.1 PTS fructose transporter subunit IIB [Vagococcus xieshaowenii]
MDIQFVRIDDRLIHGQVATVWVKKFNIERILVVAEEVTKNPVRKVMLEQAAPPGVYVNVITPAKLIDIYFDPLFFSSKVMLLFTNPQEVVCAVKKGVVFPSVNIGGMSFSQGKKMLTNAVAVNEEDIRSFEYLTTKGIELEVRKVFSDSKLQLMDLISKKKLF